MAGFLLTILGIVSKGYVLLIFARFLMDFGRVDPLMNPITRIIYNLTEPVLSRIRRLLPPCQIDLSLMAAIIGVLIIERVLTSVIITLF